MPTKAEMPAQDNKPVALAIPQWRADQHVPRPFEWMTEGLRHIRAVRRRRFRNGKYPTRPAIRLCSVRWPWLERLLLRNWLNTVPQDRDFYGNYILDSLGCEP